MRLVVFDFDGTLYMGETLRLFLRVLAGRGGKMRRAVRRYYLLLAPVYLAYKLGLCRLPAMTLAARSLVGLLAGMSRMELDEYFRECLAEGRPQFNPAALARIREHLAGGDRVILLSGAYAPFLAVVAEDLGLRDWLGTEILMQDGRCAGMGTHCIGPSKIAALHRFLAEQERAGARFELAEAYAYADGIHDLPLLLVAGHPVAVNPDQRLRREAERRGWEII